MHDRARYLAPGGYPLIHSTELIGGRVLAAREERVSADSSSTTTGPSLLLPRVGVPNPNKVSYLAAGRTVALSDCVIAVEFLGSHEAMTVRHRLTNGSWPDVLSAYSGSCARFITLDRLNEVLLSAGVVATFRKRPQRATNVWR
jgi:hypothetical protein